MKTPPSPVVRSLRICAHINLRQARIAKRAGHLKKAAHHLAVALECREDAHSLRRTSHNR